MVTTHISHHTQKDALEMATILSRRDNCEYRVMVEYWVAFGTSAK